MTEDFVISGDGTRIGFRVNGSGPGLLVVHGSMSTGQNQADLAAGLADRFTVYLMDRRGRGLSGPYSSRHQVSDDVADVRAVLEKTGAAAVFGISVGGIIALEAVLAGAAIARLALYEPPFFSDAGLATAMKQQIGRELAAGKTAAALTTAMQGARMGPEFLNSMPHGLATLLTKLMLRGPAGAPFAALAPALVPEGEVIAACSSPDLARYAAVRIPVLLLGGGRSSAFLGSGLDRLERVLPDARRVTLPGADHSAAWNRALRGKPDLVAASLREFF